MNQGHATSDAYFLKSSRLGFRCWSMEDLPLAVGLWGDIEVTRFLGGPFNNEQILRKLETEITRMEAHNIQYWPIFLLSNGDHVGCCGLRPYKLEEGIPELGYHLRPKYWGQGFAVEASQAVIRLGFETFGAKALFAGHYPENHVSRKVLEKLGFRYTHHEIYKPTGVNNPSYLLSCSEWESNPHHKQMPVKSATLRASQSPAHDEQ
jgi:[ribosomal protein S5]-alanine N-acetyltransferase